MGKAKLIAVGALALTALLATSVSAEVAQKQGVRVTVDGGLKPTKLPRKGQVPVAVSVKGAIAATRQGALPQLKAIQIAINKAGTLNVKGIPHCRINKINPSTTEQALAQCRSSLIGEGDFSADVVLPEQSPFPSKGKLLAFNGTIGRKPAVFAHVYGTEPLSTSYVFAFKVRKAKGTFGTVLEASFPKATGDWGYITGISLNLFKSRFMEAGCPAPKGFTKVAFPLVRTSFDFAGGLDIESTLNRSCQAKG
ncbi:MAG TPA: hypothetical protein VJQ84_07760 [Solirubrobacterales bacterium]|nr:hypothetical protein [Solirubrobacterales bacterium]